MNLLNLKELIDTGTATKGKGGSISITVGNGDTVAGGVLTLRAGATTTTKAKMSGGHVFVSTGLSNVHTGGFMSLFTGQGTATSSGSIVVKTTNLQRKHSIPSLKQLSNRFHFFDTVHTETIFDRIPLCNANKDLELLCYHILVR